MNYNIMNQLWTIINHINHYGYCYSTSRSAFQEEVDLLQPTVVTYSASNLECRFAVRAVRKNGCVWKWKKVMLPGIIPY